MVTVTEAIRLAGLAPGFEFVTPHGLARGSAVHAAINLDETGRLDESSVHAEVAPRLESWRLWRRAAGLVYERGEVEVQGPGYVGHPDVIGTINGERWLLDVKGGSPAPWHAIQTALYAAAIGTPRMKRGAVYVQSDGKIARLVEHHDRTDFAVGAAVVAVATWKKNHGVD